MCIILLVVCLVLSKIQLGFHETALNMLRDGRITYATFLIRKQYGAFKDLSQGQELVNTAVLHLNRVSLIITFSDQDKPKSKSRFTI